MSSRQQRRRHAVVPARQVSVFDLIGNRRWFYLISAIVLIPGLISILLTPISGGKLGLQFSIDFTGGTVWEIGFKGDTPSTTQIQQVLSEQGLPGTVAVTTAGDKSYILIRTE